MSGNHPQNMSVDASDALLREAMSHQTMPQGLAQDTLAFIARQTQGTTSEPPLALVAAPTANTPVSRASRKRLTRRRFVQLAAAAVVVGSLGVASVSFASETAQVLVGGSCWIELGLNRWGRVVRLAASDPAALERLEELGVWGCDGTQALSLIAGDEALAGCLGQDGTVELVANSKNSQQLEDVLATCNDCAVLFGENTRCYGGNGHGTGQGTGGQGQQGTGHGQGGGQGQQGMGHGQGRGYGRGQWSHD